MRPVGSMSYAANWRDRGSAGPTEQVTSCERCPARQAALPLRQRLRHLAGTYICVQTLIELRLEPFMHLCAVRQRLALRER